MTAIKDSSVLAEGCQPASPVSQPTISGTTASPPSRGCSATNPPGFDPSRAYFPPARRPRATRPPADAFTMVEFIAAIVNDARP